MVTAQSDSDHRGAALAGGLVLIALGAVFLVVNLDLVGVVAAATALPWMVLLALGGGRLLGRRPWHRAHGGMTMVVIGAWGVSNAIGLAGLGWSNSWPLLLIGFGAIATVDAVFGRRGSRS
jgi:hypothetical protein